ncbi:MAG: Fe-S protein assembly co-chaperone HscB [Candidatus Dasytiphilus stammeri]
MNYFDVFQLPVNFKIDTELLSTRFYDLQRKFHPDRYLNFSHQEKLYSLQQSSLLNKAWQVLRNPLLRAEYLLTLYGLKVSHCTMKDINFLREQIKLHEECEKLEKTLDVKKINEFSVRMDITFKKLHQQMEFAMENQQWEKAVDIIHQIHFYNRIRRNIEELENQELEV